MYQPNKYSGQTIKDKDLSIASFVPFNVKSNGNKVRKKYFT